MAKLSGQTWMAIAVVTGIVAVLMYTGAIQTQAVVNPQQVPITQGGALCDNGNNQPVVTYGGYWEDVTNNNQKTAATTLAQFFIPGEAINRVYTTFIGSNSTTAGNLACGQNYNLLLGDGGNVTYYYTVVSVPALAKTQINLAQVELMPSGAPTLSISNVTSFEQVQVIIPNTTFTTGVTGTATIKAVVKKVNDGTCFGDKGWGMCFRYNATSFEAWRPQVAYTEFTQTFVTGQDQQAGVKCYKISEEPLCGGTYEIGLQGECQAGVSCAGEDDSVDIVLTDFTGVPFNGNLIVGTDNGVGSGAQTDVGRSNPNLNAAVLFIDG